jgi:eukaryotic-like serine/threonine-protein kinase
VRYAWSKAVLAEMSKEFDGLYSPLAFLQNDTNEMARQRAWAAGKAGVDDVLLALEAGTAAYSGRLEKARELSRLAVAAADRTNGKGRAAGYKADAALREALIGRAVRARHLALAALDLSTDPLVEFVAGLALAIAHDASRAAAIADKMGEHFPQDTLVELDYVPTIRAQIALNRHDTSRAIEVLQSAAPFELGVQGEGGFHVSLYPAYVRGQAYLAAGRYRDAVAEFEKILNHSGASLNEIIGPLAHLGAARAYAAADDNQKARVHYESLLALWKNADPDVPMLQRAQDEYKKLR